LYILNHFLEFATAMSGLCFFVWIKQSWKMLEELAAYSSTLNTLVTHTFLYSIPRSSSTIMLQHFLLLLLTVYDDYSRTSGCDYLSSATKFPKYFKAAFTRTRFPIETVSLPGSRIEHDASRASQFRATPFLNRCGFTVYTTNGTVSFWKRSTFENVFKTTRFW